MSKFKVAEYADEVDEEYIRKALRTVYDGRTYTEDFSDKLIKVLLSDYKKKIKNLGWFFKDADGRVRNYISMQPNPAEVLSRTASSSAMINKMIIELERRGATYTPEEFMKNRCTINNQVQKISKVLMEDLGKVPYSYDAYTADNSPDLFYKGSKITIARATPIESGIVQYKDGAKHFLKHVYAKEDLEIEMRSKFSGYSQSHLEEHISAINSEELIISMDLADIISCSTGSCRSCLSVDNIHSAGALQNFRTEFSVITFTSKGNNRLEKRGRSWLFLRLTEKGFIRDNPFWKQQKSYGSVSRAHQNLLTSTIEGKVKNELNLEGFRTKSGFSSFIVSPNVHSGATNQSHTSAPGYIDTASDGASSFYVLPHKSNNFFSTREVLLPFKDMLDLEGNVSNITSFHRREGGASYFGAMEPNHYMVICSITGEEVLDCDAVEINDKWYAKDAIGSIIDPTKKVEVNKHEVVQEEPEEDYDDIDFDEDEF